MRRKDQGLWSVWTNLALRGHGKAAKREVFMLRDDTSAIIDESFVRTHNARKVAAPMGGLGRFSLSAGLASAVVNSENSSLSTRCAWRMMIAPPAPVVTRPSTS